MTVPIGTDDGGSDLPPNRPMRCLVLYQGPNLLVSECLARVVHAVLLTEANGVKPKEETM